MSPNKLEQRPTETAAVRNCGQQELQREVGLFIKALPFAASSVGRRLRWPIFPLAAVLFASPALAATYYLSPSGNDSAAGSSAAPWKTFSKAWGSLGAGDTLIVKDGSYSSASPPDGKAGASGSPITIQAENEGGVSISNALDLANNSYLTFIGLKITGGTHAIAVSSGNKAGKASHHLTFQRVGWNCTSGGGDDACFAAGDGTNHMLIEDCWGWGKGRYQMVCYGGNGGGNPNLGCNDNIYRRIVIRQGPDTSSSGQPQAAFSLYYANNNIVENVLAINGQPGGDSSKSAFYITGHGPPPNADNNKFLGVMALNNGGTGWFLDCSGATCNNNQLKDSVIWDAGAWGTILGGSSCTGSVVDHVTIASSANDGYHNDSCPGATMKSNILYNNTIGAYLGGGSSLSSNNYNDYFGNGTARTNVSVGANDKAVNPSFLYVGRTETGSATKGLGESGTDMGGKVVTRYVDGVLTSTPLWPWPNEARIKADMCTGSDASRGFCAKSSLTEYVWTYLGNANPYTGVIPPPPPPPGSACDVSGDGSTNVSDVQLCVNQAIGISTCLPAGQVGSGDIDGANGCNVIDVQRVVNAAMGGTCVTQ